MCKSACANKTKPGTRRSSTTSANLVFQICINTCNAVWVQTDENNGMTYEERVFAREVRRHRERLGLSQAELLARLHDEGLVYMNQTALSRLENGSRPARMIEAIKLAKLFGVSVGALINPDSRDIFLDSGRALHRRALDQRRQILTQLKELAQMTDDATAALEGLDNLWNLDEEDSEHRARIEMVKKQLWYVASGHVLGDVKQFVDRYVEGERDITSPRYGQ